MGGQYVGAWESERIPGLPAGDESLEMKIAPGERGSPLEILIGLAESFDRTDIVRGQGSEWGEIRLIREGDFWGLGKFLSARVNPSCYVAVTHAVTNSIR